MVLKIHISGYLEGKALKEMVKIKYVCVRQSLLNFMNDKLKTDARGEI